MRFAFKPSLAFKQRKRKPPAPLLIAYDLETTRIAAGTPAPVYLTAFSSRVMNYAARVDSLEHLGRLVVSEFLRDDLQGARFVAWNGNRYDAFFIAASLVTNPAYVLQPYLTRGKTLRGLRVIPAEHFGQKNAPCWEFLDGIAMLGLVGFPLSKLVATFAPDFPKLTNNIDFDKEEFNPDNPQHCAYAMRDSEGLYHAMTRAQQIMIETFDEPLGVTMGGACIKIFTAHIPAGVEVEALIPDTERVVIDYVMRGGFCFCAQRYAGPIWKYDINQAYAAAMRESLLPAGSALNIKGPPPPMAKVYIVRIKATNPRNKIPFYHRAMVNGRIRSLFSVQEIPETWVTCDEYRQLQAEGWRITALETIAFSQAFSMTAYVDKLETLRTTCEGDPSGPIGTMVKATGNHSYGKTVEQIEPIQYVLAAECPPDCVPYYSDDPLNPDPIEHVYWRIDADRKAKAHHQPHIGAFITAHVRMKVRRAALIDPDAWLYADTDCVIFSRDVTAHMDIDAKRYGAWKIEETGTPYRITAKKVYSEIGGGSRSAKGLNVRNLTDDDFAKWHEGEAPIQEQLQLQNFLATMHGAEMFRKQKREGTRIYLTESTP